VAGAPAGRFALALACAALTMTAAGCASASLYGPPARGTAAPHAASHRLRLFRQAETGHLARAFQADAAAFNRDSRNRHIPPAVLGEAAYQVSGDIAAWSQAMRRVPVPAEYRQPKARLLRGLDLLRRGYRHIGGGLLYGEPGQLGQGRADVRAGSRILGGVATVTSL